MDDTLKVSDLKKELKRKGLPISGTKDILLKRLQSSNSVTTAEVTAKSEVDSTTLPNVDNDICNQSQLEPTQQKTSEPVSVETMLKEDNPANTRCEDSLATWEMTLVSMKNMSEADKLLARAAKFGGSVSESVKKELRAKRFGLRSNVSSQITSSLPSSTDNLKKRADRFGLVISNLQKTDEDTRKLKRLQRFKTTDSTPTSCKKIKLATPTANSEEQKLKRAQRFGMA